MIFVKKKYEYTRTVSTDFHSHILPNMDDGSKSTEMSLQMVKSLRNQGIKKICLTSHYYSEQEDINTYLLRRRNSAEKLFDQTSLKREDFIFSAETAFFNGISHEYEINSLCYNGKNTLLLEMPFTEWTSNQVEEVISLYLDRGIQIILAHPERFVFSSSNRLALEKFSKMKIAFQINAGTLVNRHTRETGIELLEITQLPLLGSDAHNMSKRPPLIGEAEEILEKKNYIRLIKEIESTGKEILSSIL